MDKRPKTIEQLEKKPKEYHFVLSGWKNEYSLDHPNYFKIPYSSHSSGQELIEFCKAMKPDNLILNLKQYTDDVRVVDFMTSLTAFSGEGKALLESG